MDQIINWSSNLKLLTPWAFFLAGIAGSFHCIGMCGGLVTASCSQGRDTFLYQIGRLTGYLSLGFVFGWLGETIQSVLQKNFWLSQMPALLMGAIFIWWGLQILMKTKIRLPGAHLANHVYRYLWNKGWKLPSFIHRGFLVGLLSIFLPCGLLYGILLASLGLENKWYAMLAVGLFWAGTLPGMVFAPILIKKILSPLKLHLPKFYSASLILIGLVTVSYRFVLMNKPHTHQQHHHSSSSLEKPSCH